MGANGGLGNNMWGTIVDTSGIVCAVAFSGGDYTSQWLGSRVISAQKANTGNAFSLGLGAGGTVIALSSANLFSAVQPGGSLYGLQASNPVETDVAYGNSPGGQGNAPANAATFGTTSDPLVGQRVGGINVFGGGLALYAGGKRLGGLGVSGDTSCTDHMVAWRTRNTLHLDGFVGVGGVNSEIRRVQTTSSLTSWQIPAVQRAAPVRRPMELEGSGRAPADSAIQSASAIRILRPSPRCRRTDCLTPPGDGTEPASLPSLCDSRRG